jgi:hypothetical protein
MKLKRNSKRKTTALNKLALLAGFVLLSGCDSRNSLQHLDSQKLKALARDCKAAPPSAPGQIIACQNIERECTRRADKGLGACL